MHNIENEIKADKKTPKNRKYTWIDECVLQFTKDERTNGIMNGYDPRLAELSSGEVVTLLEKFCYINVKELCHDIIRGAKEYIKTKNVSEKLPKLKINNGGGRMPNSFDPEIFTNNMRLWNKHMKNLKSKSNIDKNGLME